MTARPTANRLSHGIALLSAMLLPQLAPADARSQVVEGELTSITRTAVSIGGARSFRIDPLKTKCFDFRGDSTTCATLAGVGYADKARVTFAGDVAQRIDILKLQQ